ncbi:hypothetical protein HYPSUDRAFT_133157 [Hypholoma sublateritium FD-334 SS-4]|uniref:DNA polymerase eta n=1 Tax=Hypholoma sublateritium (strain FD-334 SS-4) TaxID=945553 RepID=A0A0D2LFE8_HYPSF|nr:hypothetical protein HYPSUDRAFT_133157 [Hypholoma sublateritium FD-334 SS-4]
MSSVPPLSPRKSLWKGKAKAIQAEEEEEFDDINPVITYRHILSQNLGVRDPLRVIALCDSDAFYAACEMNRLGVDKDQPLVVLQWDSLIAVNYPARTYGISRMDKKKDALKRCPHLKVVHVATYKEGEKEPGYWDDVDTNTHKVSLDYYRRESMKIAALIKENLPGCEVEKASIDEAFIDFTKPVREMLLQRHPYLAQVPPEGVDTPLPPAPSINWDGLGNLIPVNPVPLPEDKVQTREDGGTRAINREKTLVYEEEIGDSHTTWHDVALSIAAELMSAAKEQVRAKLGYTTSAGISRNKFLAKLTASYKKFNTQSVLRNAAIPNYLKPMQFQKIRFLGGKLGSAIAKEYDASTVGDLLLIDEMQSKFGENSIWVYEILRGVDRNEVKDKGSALNKSMLASKNLPKPITKPSEGYHWIRVLAAELALRLNDAREMSPNLWPKTLVLHARKGYESGRSKQAAFPFTRDLTVDTIALAGDKLWNELVGSNTALKVTNVQLAFTGIDTAEIGQSSIEGFLKPSSSKKRSRESPEHHEGTDSLGNSASELSHTCPRCGKIFTVPTVEGSGDDQQDILLKVKTEHDDFHFAQDLARQSGQRTAITVSPKTKAKPTKRRKVQPEPKGIEKFFRK